MDINVVQYANVDYPARLKETVNAPRELYYRGQTFLDLCKMPCVAIVGSRKVTPYGRVVTEQLAGDLARQGVVIISGLAFGVDAIAHQAAIKAGGLTIAILAGGLDDVYPTSHQHLADQIIETGGALVSEYPLGAITFKDHFIARNRIVSGLSRGVLITEAAHKSGTLHTANFALEQGREVMAVPGNITSLLSAGTNALLRAGATPVTCSNDVLTSLGLEEQTALQIVAGSPEEAVILELLGSGVTDNDTLLQRCKLAPAAFNQSLTMLELAGHIKPAAGGWLLI